MKKVNISISIEDLKALYEFLGVGDSSISSYDFDRFDDSEEDKAFLDALNRLSLAIREKAIELGEARDKGSKCSPYKPL